MIVTQAQEHTLPELNTLGESLVTACNRNLVYSNAILLQQKSDEQD